MALSQVYQWLKKGLLAGAWILALQDFFIHFKNFTKCLVYSPFQVLGIHTREIESLPLWWLEQWFPDFSI